ncbi:MAG: hypothetical protein ACRBK7_14440 [Acidimicrobiales bacterium]
MTDTDTMIAIGRVLRHLDDADFDVNDQPDDIAHALGSAPLGAVNPAMEAAIATARFMADLDDWTTYRSKLRKTLGDAS